MCYAFCPPLRFRMDSYGTMLTTAAVEGSPARFQKPLDSARYRCNVCKTARPGCEWKRNDTLRSRSGRSFHYGQGLELQDGFRSAGVLEFNRFIAAIGAELPRHTIDTRDGMSQMAWVIAAAAEHKLDAGRVFAQIFNAHAGERQMPLFALRADFAEDLQLSRTRLIALAESLEIFRPVFPSDLVLHVSYALVSTSRLQFNRRFQTTLRIACGG